MIKIGIVTLLAILSISLFAQSNTKQEMKLEKVKIDVWSDVVCPFCFIGKKKMEQAIDKLGAEDQVEIVWHSFQLDPTFPAGTSMPSPTYLTERKGYPAAQLKAASAQLANQGKGYGINFQFDNALTFNTWDAHRLIQWAKTLHKSNELKEALMKTYFEEGIDLSQQANLLSVIKEVGLDPAKAKEVLDTDAFSEAVQQDIQRSRLLGVSGVPYFLINEQQSIYGAQSDQVFEDMISAALKQVKATESATQEGVCLPEGACKP